MELVKKWCIDLMLVFNLSLSPHNDYYFLYLKVHPFPQLPMPNVRLKVKRNIIMLNDWRHKKTATKIINVTSNSTRPNPKTNFVSPSYFFYR